MVGELETGQHDCIHRGKVLRTINCRCAGNANVYACTIHNECMIRKLRPASPVANFCNVCQDKIGTSLVSSL